MNLTLFEITSETIPFKICPLAGRIGAEIMGVDLSQDLSQQVVQAIRQTLVKYKVIFFRDQNLDSSGQVAFARRFGQLTSAHPTMRSLDNHPEVLELDCRHESDRGNHWHTDITFIDRPPMGTILRAVEIPPVGGDTIWANTTTAYQDLPKALQQFADQLWAVHSNVYDSAEATFNCSDSLRDAKKLYTSTVYQALHPVVHVHPESGDRALILGSFVSQLQEFPKAESRQICQLLSAYILRPRNTVRWHWQTGDIAFWDNRATQHYAIDDFDSQPRFVQRVTIVGDLLVSVDGRKSQAIQGDSSAYNQLKKA
ncbi:TauD/TfdA dioxygenase family protein [Microcystis aeruginosa]|jgi:alpha-ketoglutarate-dependent taurine dioxygenase|uniref:TauD/TfdA family dioxygenase n=2 Tax=Microcystis aeruginosa TaxID=1126 RepID=A0A552E3B6_MICAE|nr:TauD/TfdA family dioxygenase [Microcystis aeruginosa]TRT82372.1 MAG: TauD/TfdA family dioxygenase [Microcystis aeruginosa Ma_AC_P_19900807_S299]TRU02273.1 MAG: TauD/TfdA family dioxygenase [Microcystis aeruginosa Ma_OC_LR_19540900_S633]TRU28976.1 MAG: TauD/TfdA family dioxygenase [Microcystis aeruginosa Ma_SC_T_19800800_S464]